LPVIAPQQVGNRPNKRLDGGGAAGLRGRINHWLDRNGLELLVGIFLASSHRGAAIGLFYAETGDFGGWRGGPGLLGSAGSLDAPATGEERIPGHGWVDLAGAEAAS
jgi:hypothetical protein